MTWHHLNVIKKLSAKGGLTIKTKNNMPAVSAAAVCLLAAAGFAQDEIEYGWFRDERNGAVYNTMAIGTQTWMAENLNFETANSSLCLHGSGCMLFGSWCYDNDISNCAAYGRLYTWHAAKTACPAGWHLPSDGEWSDLMTAVGGGTAGTKLKSKTGWHEHDPYYIPGTDDYGFSALPGGYYVPGNGDFGFVPNVYGVFYEVGYTGYWWSATEYDIAGARYYNMDYGNAQVNSDYYDKNMAYSVRCVMDDPTSTKSPPARSSAPRSAAVLVTVRDRTLRVRGMSSSTESRVRLIDMRGKSVSSFTAVGAGSFSLGNIPAGRYFVEVQEGAKRERVSVIIGVR